MVSDVERVRLQWGDRRKRLIIRVGAFLIKAMFHKRRMRWEVVRGKVVSGCGLSGILLDAMTNEIMWRGHVATTLHHNLNPFFKKILGVSRLLLTTSRVSLEENLNINWKKSKTEHYAFNNSNLF